MKAGGKSSELLNYLLDKRTELKELRLRDAVLAKTVVDIHRHKTHTRMQMIPLHQLYPIHAIDRDNAIEKINQRAEILAQHQQELLQIGQLSKAQLLKFLPSVSGFKAIQRDPEVFITFEGNGRLAALQEVFSASEPISVEVEVYYVDQPEKIQRRVSRVRHLNRLPPEDKT